MTVRPCLDCGRPTDGNRCPTHRRERESQRAPRPTTLTRDAEERKRRTAAVAAHRARFGDWCPGWKRPAHDVVAPNVLTADHIVAAAHGGTELSVLCHRCNSSKGDR